MTLARIVKDHALTIKFPVREFVMLAMFAGLAR
jgi:hypothetical protein